VCAKPTKPIDYETVSYEKPLQAIYDHNIRPVANQIVENDKSKFEIDNDQHYTSKWCSTKYNFNKTNNGPFLSESTLTSNSEFQQTQHASNIQIEKYKMTSTLIRQQTKMLIKNGYYYKANNFDAIPEKRNYENYELFDKLKSANLSGIDKMCSFCLINTIQEDVSSACKCNLPSTTAFPSSIATKTEYTPPPPMYQDDYDSSTHDSMESSYTSNESTTVDQPNDIFVCCFQFKAQNPGDLNIKYGEKVRVIYRSDNKQFVLVQMLGSGICGYVPSYCLTTLNRFLSV
jgi:hypothetical protein